MSDGFEQALESRELRDRYFGSDDPAEALWQISAVFGPCSDDEAKAVLADVASCDFPNGASFGIERLDPSGQ